MSNTTESELSDALLDGVLDLYSLYEVGRAIGESIDLEHLLTTTLKRIAEIARIESYALFVLDHERDALTARGRGGAIAQGLSQAALAAKDGLASRVCRTRQPEMHAGPGPLRWRDTPAAARAVFAVPLIGRHRVLGALLMYSASPAAFTRGEQRAYFAALCKQLGTALDNATLHGQAKELSYQDALTGLFNRRYLEHALEVEVHRAARHALSLSLAMVDVDHFKAYNDAHGHARGDEVLRVIAQSLGKQTRSADIVARYGGEEFVVILPMTTKPQARLVAEHLRAAVAGIALDDPTTGHTIRLTISLGVAAFPVDASTAIGLLQAADAALYEAKDRGRNRVEVFSPTNPL
jgi:diguanylate cyclase (GGDEF)-like protein